MAIKISALPAVVTPAATDQFEVNQAGVSKRMTRAQIHTLQTGEAIDTAAGVALSLKVAGVEGLGIATSLAVTLADQLNLSTGKRIQLGDADDFISTGSNKIFIKGREGISFTQSNPSSAVGIFTFTHDTNDFLNASSGNQAFLRLFPEISQSGTAGYTALLVDALETQLGSGLNLLANFKVDGVSKVEIRNDGRFLQSIDTNKNIFIGLSSNQPTIMGLVDGLGSASQFKVAGNPLVLNGVFAGDPVGIGKAPAAGVYLDILAGAETSTSGTKVGIKFERTYNQASGTAANTDLLVNRIETVIGSGLQRLADFQKGSASQIFLSNTATIGMLETITPTAVTNYAQVYTKADNKLYFQDGAGVEHELAVV